MMKRILTICMVVCLVPMMAHAWVLNTWVKSGGGSIQVASGTPQTSVNGSVNKTYTGNIPMTVTVAASTGYTVSQVNYNGVVQAAPISTSYQVNGPSNQNVYATFAPKTVLLTASVAGNTGGTVNISSLGYTYGTKLTAPKNITFTPKSASYRVESISGIPAVATKSSALPAAAGASVTVTLPTGFIFTDDISLMATFTNADPVAVSGAPQVVALGPVTLDGSGSQGGSAGITSYQWAQVSGPVVTLSNPTAAKANFTSTAVGTYTFSLKVMPGGSTSSTTVTVTANAAETVQIQCQNCHASSGITTATTAYTKWSTSKHEANTVICAKCHSGVDSGAHPGTISTNICISCHNAPLGASPAVAVGHHGISDTLANTCYSCHNHDLGVSGAGLTCTSCHTNPPTAGQYYTGHQKYTHVSGSNCADCHSVPPTTDATATHRDGKIEILTNNTACAACHSYPPASHTTYNAVAGTSPNCSNCHTYTDFNGATHNNGTLDVASLSCTTCHGNPPQVLTVAKSGHTGQHLNVSNCDMCHGAGAADGTSANHKNGTVNTLKSGAPHFNNATSGMYPAAYVTSTSTCANCHNSNANNQAIRQQWAATGHANTTALPWIDYDFKTRVDGCVRCHTTTGFIAYSTAKVTAAWGTASDKTKEVLTCVGCHSDVANGVVRSVTPNNPFADEATFTNADVGTSNICMDCHSGRNNGTSIQAKVTSGADFTNLSYIAPHYLTAGGSLQGKSGYSFPGRTYAALSDNAHSKAGTANSNNTGSDGPCVGCHMSATAKHTFSPVTDASGTITAITTTFCANCHTDSSTFNAGVLDAKKVAFTNALAVLKAALADKGIVVTDNYPYVANKNWGTGQAGANVMGAAFNYKLFAAEPGAYAHNPAYAKQLIADSIEAVATGGSVTGSDVSAYVTSLVGKGVTADQVSSYNTFKNTTSSCASCHSFPPASSSHASATTSPLNCTNCHIYTGMGGATHNNGTVDFGAMTCTSCHPNLSSSHAVHVGNLPSLITAYGGSDTNFMNNNTDSTGYRFGCATCHPSTNANHKNGTIVLNGNGYQQATKVSVTCTAAACHADGKSNYVTSPDWYTGYTGADRCAMCHAATPTTGSHTVHTAINGIHDGSSGITYAATVTCANCHADTVDSAKNINYVNHANGIVSVSFATTNVVSKAQISASSFNAYSTVWTRTGATDTSKLPLSAGNYAGGTCSTIACHNNGTTPAWGTTVKISCVDCHSTL